MGRRFLFLIASCFISILVPVILSSETNVLNPSELTLVLEAPPLPKNIEFFKKQCAIVKEEQAHLTPEKIQAIFYWAGLTSMKAGKWGAILEDYMAKQQVPIEKRLLVRSFFISALLDSNAVAFNSKYTNWIKRPSQVDPEVATFISVPNHPSYPSAHSTIGYTAATILSDFFPENQKEWNRLAEEAGMSRIWGGIHYPVDHQQGRLLGQKVAAAILEKTND